MSHTSNTNYILHLNKVAEIMFEDKRLSPYHISLYMALFHEWNAGRFRNPLKFNKHDIMQAAHISSFTTYTKIIKELHDWNYLKYHSSRNPLTGSSIFMNDFSVHNCTTESDKCTTACTTNDHEMDKS